MSFKKTLLINIISEKKMKLKKACLIMLKLVKFNFRKLNFLLFKNIIIKAAFYIFFNVY